MSQVFIDLQSRIPSPPSILGSSRKGDNVTRATYKGEPLPLFIYKNGGDFTKVREFLQENRIGSPFDLKEGIILEVRQK